MFRYLLCLIIKHFPKIVILQRLEERFNKLQPKDMSNVDRLMMVDYWLTRGQSTLAARLEELQTAHITVSKSFKDA